MGEQSIASAINSLFKDAYRSLEQVQEHADEIESFSDSIVSCHWAISNLERIHRIYSQNPYSTLAQDAFSLRSNLERFIGSCHALIRLIDLLAVSSDVGCFIGGGKTAMKRKKVRELQEEFWDHQRILSLVLANAVYMTTLDMQKENAVPDAELETILRQSQKRHTVYEKTDKAGQEHKSQKPAESHVEQLEFSVCLRKYFDYIERQAKKQAEIQRRLSQPAPTTSTALVRYSASSQTLHEQQWSGVHRRKSLTYGNSIDGTSYNEIYTRPRRNSTASRPPSMTASSRHNSFTSVQSAQTIVNSSAQPSPLLPTMYDWDRTTTLPDRRSSPPVRSSTTEENIGRAWTDIMNATHTMSILEARAYIEGRLAGLDPNTITHIRQAMSASNLTSPSFSTPTSDLNSPDLPSPTSLWGNVETERQSSRPHRPHSMGPTVSLTAAQSMPTIRMVPPPAAPERAASDPVLHTKAKRQSHPRSKSDKRLSGVRNDHARQLSTIVERPSTAKSRGESIKSRKTIFNLKKDKPLPVPKRPDLPVIERKTSGGSHFSSDGSTLRGGTPEETRVFDLEEVPEEPGPLPDIKTKRRTVSKAITSKPLPMTPGELQQPGVSASPASSVKSKISRFLSPLSRRSVVSIPSTLSTPSLSSAQAGMRSRETLGQFSNASLECLRKGGMNGSRSTLLVAYQEGPDQPFQVWLNALPYIEGRAGARV